MPRDKAHSLALLDIGGDPKYGGPLRCKPRSWKTSKKSKPDELQLLQQGIKPCAIGFSNVVDFVKAIYISQILKILVHYLAKISLMFVFVQLIPSKQTIRALWLFILFLTLWAGSTIFTIAFQCPLPRPWDVSTTGCLSQVCDMYFS